MTQTVFLDRDQYWKEIAARVPSARKVIAAIAYFGNGGASYLPLREGDELLVDLSIKAVKQGVTDPREIEALMKRGVHVYTRQDLHAKLIVIDDIVIASSANVSKNARQYLDEAGILSASPAAVKAATHFIRSRCSEPVRRPYLKECISLYKPPTFKAAKTIPIPKKGKPAKVWFVTGLRYINVDKDKEQIERLEEQAALEMVDPDHCFVRWIRYPKRPKWFADIRRHNWVVDCARSGKRTFDVGPAVRVIGKRKYTTKEGKTYHVLMLESPIDGECMTLTAFRERWRKVAPKGKQPPKRTQPITDSSLGDAVLRFWTRRGKVSKGRLR